MAKTYFDQQQVDDKILSGVYPIVIEKGNAHIENNIINGKGAIAANYDSKIVVKNLNRTSTTDYLVKAIKNSWISYRDTFIDVMPTATSGNFFTKYNSVVNFPKPSFGNGTLSTEDKTGGVVSFNPGVLTETSDNRPHKFTDLKSDAAKWSSHFINDGNEIHGMKWQDSGKMSFFYTDGTLDWHNTATGDHYNLSSWIYEPINNPESIYFDFPDVCGHDITIRTVDINTNHTNVSFLNIKGKLTLRNLNTNTTLNGLYTFRNIDNLILESLSYTKGFITYGSYVSINTGNTTSITSYSSYINYSLNTNLNLNNFYASCVKLNNYTLLGITNTSGNDVNYNENFYVKNSDNVNNVFDASKTQFIYFSTTSVNSLVVNNSIKYSLIRHSHQEIFAYPSVSSNVTGVTLNTNDLTLRDIQDSAGNRTLNGGNYDDKTEYGLRRTTLNALPIGTITGWYQIKNNGVWKPEIPYGFYQLGTRVEVDVDDPSSLSYNGDFMHLFADNGENSAVWTNGYIQLPAGNNIENGNVRIISIIKYNHNVTFRT